MIERLFSNTAERKLLGGLLSLLKPAIRTSTRQWLRDHRILAQEESHFTGKFDPDKIPALEYIYDCCDNRSIYIIVAMKGSQVGWSELTNGVIGKVIHTTPTKMQWAFPGLEPSKVYSREKLKPFFNGTRVLKELINIGVAKESFSYFKFPGGFLKLTTLGAISSAKTSSIPFIGVEEPDDVKDDVKGQGDTLENVKGRQKTFPIGFKKLIFGGTPTDKDFSRVESGYKQSNKLVFKAECHHCKELIELSLDNLKYDDYQDRYIDELYGKHNPDSAYYECPACSGIWSFEEKNQNIENGKKFGFTDFTGNFSKGWHAERPEVTETFGFHIPELLSTLSSSTFRELAQKEILAELDLLKGNESLMKSYRNNSGGLPYASGITALGAKEMEKLRLNYPEGIVPSEGLVLTAGVDVQDNRFAYVIRAWGRNNNSWLVKWEEIFGDVLNQDSEVWTQLSDLLVHGTIPHSNGKTLKVAALSIDSADNSELVYRWVLKNIASNKQIFAVKGVRDLRHSEDEIYREPLIDITRDQQARKTIAETMGVSVFNLGAHRAHDQVLKRVNLNMNKEARSNMYYFNKQSYGSYEDQMTSCRKILDMNSSYSKPVYKLIPGRRKEAIDAEKLALHAAYASGIRNYTHAQWKAIESYLYAK